MSDGYHGPADERDLAMVAERMAAMDSREGPRVGDYVIFRDGTVARFAHDWGDRLQTTPGGSFYLGNGYLSMSGSLDRSIPKDSLTLTDQTREGSAWVFHHNMHQAHYGVAVRVPLRVFLTTEESPQ